MLAAVRAAILLGVAFVVFGAFVASCASIPRVPEPATCVTPVAADLIRWAPEADVSMYDSKQWICEPSPSGNVYCLDHLEAHGVR